jgi:mannose-1-phosphate guanylyltransferase
MNGFLLAAGLGTRFRPFSDILPKPAIPLLNVPLGFYNLHLLQQLGVDNFTLNTHHLPEKIREVFTCGATAGLKINYSDEQPEILGSGGGIKKAQKFLQGQGTFAVSNADCVTSFGVADGLEFHKSENALATMIVIQHPEAGKKYGAVWVDDKNQVLAISKTKPQEGARPMHFVGIHFMQDEIFNYFPEGPCSIMENVYLPALKRGEKILAYEKVGAWYDGGSLDDYLCATKDLIECLSNLQHSPFFFSLFRRFWPDFDQRPNIWEGVDSEHLLPLGSSSKILIGNHCRIHDSVRVNGFAVIGDGAVIERGVVLEDAVVAPNVRVTEGSQLKRTLVLK